MQNKSATTYLAQRKALLAEPALPALYQQAAPELPETLGEGLAQMALLYGVPFNNLVAHPALLPTESIRFFYVDKNWLDSLIDGAFSIGTQTSTDTAYYQAMQPVVQRSVNRAVLQIRPQLRGETVDSTALAATPIGTMTGFLLRSQVVSGWPGLETKAYTGTEGNLTEMDALRLERLAPDVLLALFPDVPTEIHLSEPPEGIGFGTDDDGQVSLRNLSSTAQGYVVGQQIKESGTPVFLTPTFRDPTTRVLDVAATQAALQTKLGPTYLDASGTLGPAGFGVQMIKAAETQVFKPNAPPAPAQADPSATLAEATRTLYDAPAIHNALFGKARPF